MRRRRTQSTKRTQKEEGGRFVPLTAETYGAMGGSMQKFIKEMVKVGMEQPNCYESKELRNELVGTVAIAIQRGNSYAIQQGHMLTRSANVQTSTQDRNGDSSQSETKSDPNSKEKQ